LVAIIIVAADNKRIALNSTRHLGARGTGRLLTNQVVGLRSRWGAAERSTSAAARDGLGIEDRHRRSMGRSDGTSGLRRRRGGIGARSDGHDGEGDGSGEEHVCGFFEGWRFLSEGV